MWESDQFAEKKAKGLGILEWMYNHVSPELSNGYISIDVRVCYKKIYLKSKASSLKYYLEKCGLGSKMDMPMTTMNKRYEDAILYLSDTLAKNIYEVANYCVIDALQCQELIVKHNVINDYREVSSIAYMSLSDSHYFAGGSRIQTAVTGLDFASLYPSLMIAYNLSPDKIILSCEEAINVIRGGKKTHMIKFLFNGQTIEAWSVCHNNIPKKKGLYARVLENLFNKRKKMKKHLNELDEESFKYSCLDSKQKALAGKVTSAGQRSIKFVRKFVEDKEFSIKYGDTDSLYLTCPEECFQECERKYKLDQLLQKEYWEEIVKISIEVMANLRNEVNTELEKDNRMPYLNMAYEEVLFPIVFIGKKKYYGLEYKNKPNFNPGSKWGNIPVERFVLQMKAKHALEVIENKWLIKRGLPTNKYLYKEYQPLPENLLKALERKKKSKKVNNLDNDEIANVKDEESQKLAKKWLKNYIKNLCDGPKKEETIISHLWKEAIFYAEKNILWYW
ncbi:hypothetical protein C2G38_2192058 [Gigaspora rosea]|uniref:DNA-directed DNA polymerase n=1 Tax=Gigaspora rosea TaxID=44941 RepID=A0A397UZC0_9GLOM|nr:hypothetical protein C2G38_2192058 [Gigaspora rosea]